MDSEALKDAYGWKHSEVEELSQRFDDAKRRVNVALKSKHFFDDLADEIHPTNVEKGFWGPPELMDKYVAKLCLIHSEVSEVMEALRKSQGTDKVTEEFADILIRLFDLYGELVAVGEADPGLYGVMYDKMKANAARPAKHGNRWG